VFPFIFPGHPPAGCLGPLFSFAFCCTMGVLESRWWLAGAGAVLGWMRYRLDGES
jgi:hypothetical protein